jgi:hypothetical protein
MHTQIQSIYTLLLFARVPFATQEQLECLHTLAA